MNPMDQELREMADSEARKYRARAALAEPRPVLIIALQNLAIVALLGLASYVGKVPKGIDGLAVVALIFCFNLALEIKYLNRRVEALLVLQDLSRKEL